MPHRLRFANPHANGEIATAQLRNTNAVRERCGFLLARAREGLSGWFEVDDAALDGAARRVADITRLRFHNRHISLHSRWRHFEAGGIDRRKQLVDQLAGLDHVSRLRAMIDLTVVSVLLDASAGGRWQYLESATGLSLTRSEGLGVASFHAFTAGLFSSRRDRPLQVDAQGLRALATDHLAQALQVTHANPLQGLEARAVLLRRLGEAMSEQPEVFGEDGRPGGLFDMLVSPLGPDIPHTADISAHDILSQLLESLSGIGPSDNEVDGIALGDCWRHAAVRGPADSDGWVPLHRLAQWLAYSLLEPFQWGGVQVRGMDRLTGLPDYRNGGLMIDSGVLRLRDPHAVLHAWQPGDEVIVEWRALTVALLDELAPRVRAALGPQAADLPLGCILEGGTWAAGRELAKDLRGGLPPLRVAGDATLL